MMFKKNNIDIVLFGDIPHFGVDSVAAMVAKAMNIEIIMPMQSYYPNKFFVVNDVEDYGAFISLANNEYRQVRLSIELREGIKFFDYKKNINIDDFSKDIIETSKKEKVKFLDNVKGHLKEIANSSNNLKNMSETDFLNPEKYKKDSLCLLDNIREIYRKATYYFNTEIAVETVDLKEKYIYFPLHLQPELTTSGLGGIFCDQLLAIERMSMLIPEDWKIYVKENPLQGYYMRENGFFKRLKMIPQVSYVSKNVDTFDLIENSQFVATITGSVGWEAITSGKNVLVFGKAWYRKLPGVFEYNQGITINEIMDYHIEHEELEKGATQLFSKAYSGYIDNGYYGSKLILDDDEYKYSESENLKNLYESYKKIISHC